MAQANLICLFCASSGKNGENLGADEEEIAQIVYMLYDTGNNKVLSVQEYFVKPTADDISSDAILTEECKLETGLTESSVKNGLSLEQVLDELDRFLRTKELHPQQGGKPFYLCTDGPLHLRMCLHPEALRKNIVLAPYYYQYYDLRKQFKQFYKPDRNMTTMNDMLSFLSLSPDETVEYGMRHCQDMACIIHRLLNDGHRFTDLEHIMDKLDPGIFNKCDIIDDDTVVKARGLPWQSSEQDITNFFRGLNIVKGGVALCLSQQGRRNGEALVRFENGEQRSLALRRHKHHIGQRYIEVYKATGKDFLSVAGGGSREAQAFLAHQSFDGTQMIVRMRGLPYSCKAEQVIQFFSSGPTPVEVLDGEDGVLFVHQADGRATGDAFVLFASEEEACKALTKHKQLIGTRYIELFKSTTAEVQQVLSRSMDPRNPLLESKEATLLSTAIMPSFALSHVPGLAGAPQIIPGGVSKDCIRMRGLPFEAQIGDILQFLGDLSNDIVCQGVHLIYKAEGMPSGEAFIQMNSEITAKAASLSKHNKMMFLNNKKRTIEVIQCSGEEMTVILNNGLSDTSLDSVTTNGFLPPSYWPKNSHNVSTMSLQTRSTLIDPAVPFYASVMGSPSTLSGQSSVLFPANHLPLHTSVMPAAAMSRTMPPIFPAISSQPLIAVHHVPFRQPISTGTGTGVGAQVLPQFQPVLYWCASPPLSPPQNGCYMPFSSASVAISGFPQAVQVHDVLSFLDGIYETPPDVQIQRGSDGQPTGSAIVTFLSPAEADRAICDRNQKLLGNRIVDVRSVT